jgi:hypothetical protein
MFYVMDPSTASSGRTRPLRRTHRAPRPASVTYAFIGVSVADGAPATRTTVLDAQFRFTALRTMLASGARRVVVLSDPQPTAELLARAERIAEDERRATLRGPAFDPGAEQIGLVASYPPGLLDEDSPLIAISASLDEATAAALEFIDRGATAFDVVTFAGGGVAGLVQTMLELADRSRDGRD